jgi:hypothetical protein
MRKIYIHIYIQINLVLPTVHTVHTFAIMQSFNAEGKVPHFFSLHILRLSPLTLLPFYNCFIFIIFSSFPHMHPFFSSPLILFHCPFTTLSCIIQKLREETNIMNDS